MPFSELAMPLPVPVSLFVTEPDGTAGCLDAAVPDTGLADTALPVVLPAVLVGVAGILQPKGLPRADSTFSRELREETESRIELLSIPHNRCCRLGRVMNDLKYA